MPLPKGTPTKEESRERLIRSRARAKAKEVFGEKELEGMEVHHINGNNEDNRPSNLKLVTKDEHAKSHGRGHGKRGTKNIRNQQPALTEWIDGMELADSQAEPREDIMLFPFGEFEHPSYGKMVFDNDFFNEIIDNHINNVLHVKPFMDKQHDEDKALAWFDAPPFIRPGQGLFITPEYTELGNAVLQSRTYRYFSPSWGPYKDPQTGKEFKNVLRGGAATNIPFLKTMPSIIDETAVLSDNDMVEWKLTDLTTKGSSDSEGNADETIKEQTPEADNKQSNTKGEIMIDKLKEKIGLSDDASDDAILSKVDELVTSIADLTAKLTNSEKKDDSDKELTDKLSDTQKKLSDVEAKMILRDCDDAINKALSEGKLLPADRERMEKRFLSDPINVAADLEAMHPVIDLGEKGKSGEGEKKELSDPGTQLVTEAQKLVADKVCATFDEAVAKIYSDNPKLAEAYSKLYKGV